ncbi:hypothetical protein E2C01_019184 [Portunus trituberculatus]|uniref:Uncharacterized protein n=1 Tax=Portunus trituberculatus TaxID=210409 RepID=A0A5B7DZA1_PORTR|nr:hypothetical protein [Portunus trituberculatus]
MGPDPKSRLLSMLVQTTSIATSWSHTNLRKIASTMIRCSWQAEVANEIPQYFISNSLSLSATESRLSSWHERI